MKTNKIKIISLTEAYQYFSFYSDFRDVSITLDNVFSRKKSIQTRVDLKEGYLSSSLFDDNDKRRNFFLSLNDLLDYYIKTASKTLNDNYNLHLNKQGFFSKFKNKENNLKFKTETEEAINKLQYLLINPEDNNTTKHDKMLKRYDLFKEIFQNFFYTLRIGKSLKNSSVLFAVYEPFEVGHNLYALNFKKAELIKLTVTKSCCSSKHFHNLNLMDIKEKVLLSTNYTCVTEYGQNFNLTLDKDNLYKIKNHESDYILFYSYQDYLDYQEKLKINDTSNELMVF